MTGTRQLTPRNAAMMVEILSFAHAVKQGGLSAQKLRQRSGAWASIDARRGA